MSGVTPKQAILEVLIRGPNYGLGIKKAVEKRTTGQLKLGPGTLYPALRGLERDGLVVSRECEGTPERGGRARVYYELTGAGARAALETREQIYRFYGWNLGVAGV